ncbi:glycosyltransferase [Cytophagaceae bacterium ABcell3]|nr:glycosyltransferase [Cytophagaceae bacterium ABcell3]
MKIIFICGSLEPGKDGVGDYTRRLAGELVDNGIGISILSINDKNVEGILYDVQDINNVKLNVVRLSSNLKYSDKFKIAKQYIDEYKPSWVSIQFVPYSFQRRGLPFSFIKELTKVRGSQKWHIMFHELWLGIHGKISFKELLIAYLQKKAIFQLVKNTSPKLITTTTEIYKRKLRCEGVKILPLFGNIPISESNKSFCDNNLITAVYFGTFSNDIKGFESQIKFINHISEVQGKKFHLIVIGRGGTYKYQSLEVVEEIVGKGCITDMGELSPSDISRALLKSDIGISRADAILFTKSGTTTAMLEHGLPVILRGKRPNNSALCNSFRSQILFYNDLITSLPQKNKPMAGVNKFSQKFLDFLHEVSLTTGTSH